MGGRALATRLRPTPRWPTLRGVETPDDDDGTRTIVQAPRQARDDDVDRHTREFEALSLTTTGLNIRYHDGGEIGRGGSASIRQVYDRNMLRWNAVKRLDKAFAKDPTRALSFLEEARLTGQLEHPCIVPVHEVGTAEDGSPFFSMKLVRGQSLEAMIDGLGADRLAPEHLDGLLRDTFGVTREGPVASAGGYDFAEDEALLARVKALAVDDPAPLFVVAEPWASPDRAFKRFIAALREAAGVRRHINVLLTTGGEASDRALWGGYLAELGDPYLALDPDAGVTSESA